MKGLPGVAMGLSLGYGVTVAMMDGKVTAREVVELAKAAANIADMGKQVAITAENGRKFAGWLREAAVYVEMAMAEDTPVTVDECLEIVGDVMDVTGVAETTVFEGDTGGVRV